MNASRYFSTAADDLIENIANNNTINPNLLNQYINPVKNTIPTARPEPVLHSPYPTEPENGPLAGAVPTLVPPGTFTPPPVMNPQATTAFAQNGVNLYQQPAPQQTEDEIRSAERSNAVQQDMAAYEQVKNNPMYVLTPSGLYANRDNKFDVFDPQANTNALKRKHAELDEAQKIYGYNRDDFNIAEKYKESQKKQYELVQKLDKVSESIKNGQNKNPNYFYKTKEYSDLIQTRGKIVADINQYDKELESVRNYFKNQKNFDDFLNGNKKTGFTGAFTGGLAEGSGMMFDSALKGGVTEKEKNARAIEKGIYGYTQRSMNYDGTPMNLKNADGSYKTTEQLQSMGKRGIVDSVGEMKAHEVTAAVNMTEGLSENLFIEDAVRRLNMKSYEIRDAFLNKKIGEFLVRNGKRPPSPRELYEMKMAANQETRTLQAKDRETALDFLNRVQDQKLRGQTILGAAGEILARMPAFMVDMALTGGTGAAAKAGVKAGIAAQKSVLKNAVAHKILGETGSKILAKTAGKAVYEGGQAVSALKAAAPLGSLNVFAGGLRDTQQNYINDAVSADNNGNVQFDKSVRPDVYKGMVNSAAEYGSEFFGNALVNPVFAGLKRVLPKHVVIAAEKLRKLKVNGKSLSVLEKYQDKVKQAFKQSHFNGFAGEWAEERLGGAFKKYSGSDENATVMPETFDAAIAELIAFAVPGGTTHVGRMALTSAVKFYANKDLKEAEQAKGSDLTEQETASVISGTLKKFANHPDMKEFGAKAQEAQAELDAKNKYIAKMQAVLEAQKQQAAPVQQEDGQVGPVGQVGQKQQAVPIAENSPEFRQEVIRRREELIQQFESGKPDDYVTTEEDENNLTNQALEETRAKFNQPQAAAPVQQEQPKQAAPVQQDGYVVSTPVSELNIDPERFQFKSNVNKKTGVDESNKLGGIWDPVTAGNLYVWEDKNGKKFVVNGHHRFELAKQNNVQNVNTIIDREVDGVTAEQAKRKGTLINIRDEQGSVKDYADFVRHEKMDEKTAEREGITARQKGKDGFVIGKYASDNLYAYFRNGDLGPEKTSAIANIARGDEAIESAGISRKNLSAQELTEFLKLLKNTPRERNTQGDLFGFDDSALKQAEALAKLAAKRIATLHQQIITSKRVIDHPEAAKAGDIKAGENAQERYDSAIRDLERWKHWDTDRELYNELLSELEGKNQSPVSGKKVYTSENPAVGDVYALKSPKDMTDRDFTEPFRSIQLPPLPESTLKKIGKTAKPILIKKNILEKNKEHHSDLNPEDGKMILNNALYKGEIIEKPNPSNRPEYYMFVKLNNGKNQQVLLEINDNKENFEVVNFHYLGERELQQKLRRGTGLDGLPKPIISEQSSAAAGSISALQSGNDIIPQSGEKVNDSSEKKQKESIPENNRLVERMKILEIDSKDLDEKQKYVRKFFKAVFRRDIKFFRSGTDKAHSARGFYNPNTDEIYINVDSGANIGEVAFHEFTHSLRENSPKVFWKLFESCKKIAPKEKLDAYLASLNSDLTAAGTKQDREADMEDFVCDVVGSFGNNEEVLRKLAADNPSILKKVLDFIQGLKEKLQRYPGLSNTMKRLFGEDLAKFEAPVLEALNAVKAETESKVETAPVSEMKESEGKPETLREILNSTYGMQNKNTLMKRYAEKHGISLKDAQEEMEAEIVKAAREIVESGNDVENRLVKLYERQPILGARTTTSTLNQAYSTPAPLAYALGNAIELYKGESVYEPTAGTGMLTIAADPGKCDVNEIGEKRLEILKRGEFGNVTNQDASTFQPGKTYDRVIMNPPFAEHDTVSFSGYKLSKLDHIIAAKALESMKEDGKAAIIVGANTEGMNGRGKPSTPDWIFMNYLYHNFNVRDNFIVDGEMYRKQGASYPVRVLILDGKREAGNPAEDLCPKTIDLVNGWENIMNRLKNTPEAVSEKPKAENVPFVSVNNPTRQELMDILNEYNKVVVNGKSIELIDDGKSGWRVRKETGNTVIPYMNTEGNFSRQEAVIQAVSDLFDRVPEKNVEPVAAPVEKKAPESAKAEARKKRMERMKALIKQAKLSVPNSLPRGFMADKSKAVSIVPVSTTRHLSLSEAEKSLKQKSNVFKEQNHTEFYTAKNNDSGMTTRITNASIGKMVSEKSFESGAVPAYIHSAAVVNAKILFENSIHGLSHPDHKGNGISILQIHRFYTGMEYEGKNYGVKLTVREMKEGYNILYTLESRDIEVEELKNSEGVPPNGEDIESILPERNKSNRGVYPKEAYLRGDSGNIIHQASEKVKRDSLTFGDFFEKFKVESDFNGSKYKDKSIRLSLNSAEKQELINLGMESVFDYVEDGVTKFEDFAKIMISELGNEVRPYLKTFYNAARDFPGMEKYAPKMDQYSFVSGFDVERIGEVAAVEEKEPAKEPENNSVPAEPSPEAKAKLEEVGKFWEGHGDKRFYFKPKSLSSILGNNAGYLNKNNPYYDLKTHEIKAYKTEVRSEDAKKLKDYVENILSVSAPEKTFSEIAEELRLDERKSTQDSETIRPDAETSETSTVVPDAPAVERAVSAPVPAPVPESSLYAAHIPQSSAMSLGTVVPANMGKAYDTALKNLQKGVGNLDEFVTKELGYGSVGEMQKGLAAEQVEGVALAIRNLKRNDGTIIADQTGIGKGRQAAAVIAWAREHGKTPVFLTKFPKLFTDMMNDASDIGKEFHPLIIADPIEGLVEANGKIYKPMKSKQRTTEFEKFLSGDTESDVVFCAYSQLNKKGPQQAFLEDLAKSGKVLFVMDESHTAAGEDSTTGLFFRGGSKKTGSGENQKTLIFPGVLRNAQVVYFSATYAKRNDNMPLYFKTAIGGAVDNIEKLPEIMAKGGNPLQQIISRDLCREGELVRREKDMSGVKFDFEIDKTIPEKEYAEKYDGIAEILKELVLFSGLVNRTVNKEDNHSRATSKETSAVQVMNFASVVHNYINQMNLSLKAEAVINKTLEEIKANKKVVIALENTNESKLKDFAESAGIEIGEECNVSWKDVLLDAINRQLRTKTNLPNGDEVKGSINPESSPLLKHTYDRIVKMIDGVNVDSPISTIDYIKYKLSEKGIVADEITGRSMIMDYGDGKKLKVRSSESMNKNRIIDGFNNGETQVLILNQSGSTGISLHASEKFKDQRQRTMIVAQPNGDINIMMQMFGRILRSGQVSTPTYTIMSSPLAAEKRTVMNLSKKLKSLSANTTSNQKGSIGLGIDMFNKYGDTVAMEYLNEHEELQNELDMSVTENADGGLAVIDEFMRNLTGKIAVLSDSKQKQIFSELEKKYTAAVEYAKAIGEYDLEITRDEWNATSSKEEMIVEGDPNGTVFRQPVYEKKIEIDVKKDVPSVELLSKIFLENMGGHSEKCEAKENKVLERISEFKKSRPKNMTPETFSKIVDDSNGLMNRFRNWRTENTNQLLEVTQKENDPFYAVMTNVEFGAGSSVRPISASQINVELITDSGLKIKVPFSKIERGALSVAVVRKPMDSVFTGKKMIVREQRTVYTGNILKAMEYADCGRIHEYTTSDGNTETALVMPKKWSADDMAYDPRLIIKNGKSGIEYLNSKSDAMIFVDGGALTINRSGIIKVVSRKNVGGKFYQDLELCKKLGGEFAKFGGKYMARANDRMESVINYLIDKQYRVTMATDSTPVRLSVPAVDVESGEVAEDMERTPETNKLIRLSVIGRMGAEEAARERWYDKPLEAFGVNRPWKTEADRRMKNLRIAEKMRAEGLDYDRIKAATGWERGRDGEWRTETADSWKLVPKRQESTLGESLEGATELFKLYPELKNVGLSVIPMREGETGMFYPKSNRIAIKARAKASERKIALIHEIQHWIQNKEGFAGGGSAEMLRLDEDLKNYADMVNQSENYQRLIYAESEALGDSENDRAFETLYDSPDVRAIMNEKIKLREKYANDRAALEFLENPSMDEDLVSYGRYFRMAGEVEARNAETRSMIPLAERERTRLRTTEDVPEAEKIYSTGNSSERMASDALYQTDKETRRKAERAIYYFAQNPESAKAHLSRDIDFGRFSPYVIDAFRKTFGFEIPEDARMNLKVSELLHIMKDHPDFTPHMLRSMVTTFDAPDHVSMTNGNKGLRLWFFKDKGGNRSEFGISVYGKQGIANIKTYFDLKKTDKYVKGKGIVLGAVANSAEQSEDGPVAKPALIGPNSMPFFDIIPQSGEKVKRDSEESRTNPTGPTDSDGTKEIRLSVNSSGGISDVFQAFSKKDNSKYDINAIQRNILTPLHISQKHPAYGRIFEEGLKFSENKLDFKREMTMNGDVDEALEFAKQVRKDNHLKHYLIQRDMDAVGGSVANIGEKHYAMDENNRDLGEFETEAEAWETVWANEAKNAPLSAESKKALVQFRRVMGRQYEQLSRFGRKVVKSNRELGNTKEADSLWNSLKRMGDRRGYYFPRVRHGDLVLKGRKGSEKILKTYDNDLARRMEGSRLSMLGYQVDYSRSEVSQTAHSADIPTMNDLLQKAAIKTSENEDVKLETFGLESRGVVEYRRKDGEIDEYFTIKSNEAVSGVTEALKALGGRYWDDVWHFSPETKESDIIEACKNVQSNRNMGLAVSKLMGRLIADMIHSTGSRSKKISRSSARGEDVWRGYETDPVKAMYLSISATASGTAKNLMFRNMVSDLCGTDISFEDFSALYLKDNDPDTDYNTLYREYMEFCSNRAIDPGQQTNLFESASGYIDNMLRNDTGMERMMSHVRAVAAIYQLGRLSTGLINLTSLATTVPVAANTEEHLPIAQTMKYVLGASGWYAKWAVTGEGVHADVFEKMKRKGWIESQEMEESGMTSPFLNRATGKIGKVMTIAMSETEKLNRAATICGVAIQIADRESKGVVTDGILQRAKHVADMAHSVYGKANLPEWAQGKGLLSQIARGMYMYKQYPHNQLQLLGKALKTKNYKALAYGLIAPMLIGGINSMPLISIGKMAVQCLMSACGGDGDDPLELLYAWLDAQTGNDITSQVLRFGIAGAGGYGVDLSGSMSTNIEDLLPEKLSDLGGAGVSNLVQIYRGIQLFASGEYRKGTEKVLPAAISAPLRAYRESTEGMTKTSNLPIEDQNGRPIVLSSREAGFRAFGFRPATLSKDLSIAAEKTHMKNLFSEKRRKISILFRRAVLSKDERLFSNAVTLMNTYNKNAEKRGFPMYTEKTYNKAIKGFVKEE